jgi:Sulfotransferase domain
VALVERLPVLALWAVPRSRSTAFFRAMIQHGGVSALHEPFCNLKDFGETDVGGRVLTSATELISAIYGLAALRRVFFKDTTDCRHAAVLGARRLLAEAHHAFLIRRPDEVVASYYALKPHMAVGELGFENLHELYQAVTRAGGRTMVIDSDDLVANPAGTLRAYCAAAGLPFRERMLRWETGARHEWRRSSRWHQAVSGSAGFGTDRRAYRESVLTNATLAAYSAHHEPYYQLLHARRTCPPAGG